MFVCKMFKLTQCPWSSFLSGVHPLFRNYVTCLNLESQVLVTLELPLHPQLAGADFMYAHYISVISPDGVPANTVSRIRAWIPSLVALQRNTINV